MCNYTIHSYVYAFILVFVSRSVLLSCSFMFSCVLFSILCCFFFFFDHSRPNISVIPANKTTKSHGIPKLFYWSFPLCVVHLSTLFTLCNIFHHSLYNIVSMSLSPPISHILLCQIHHIVKPISPTQFPSLFPILLSHVTYGIIMKEPLLDF